ncbi:hypothetical protein HDU76_008381, partial [Blyttiomyces sp. JEL0837]
MSSSVPATTSAMLASRPSPHGANITQLPLEIIANIIQRLPMSQQSYQTIVRINRLFNNAMQIIPKVIELRVGIGHADPFHQQSLTQIALAVDFTDYYDTVMEWKWNVWDGERERTYLKMGERRVGLSPTAVSIKSEFLVQYICEMVRGVVFKQVPAPHEVKVVCDFCKTDTEYWMQQLLPFINALNPKEIEMPWYPTMFDHIKNVKSLVLKKNTDLLLANSQSFRDIYPRFNEVASAMNEFKFFLSLDGISQLTKIQKLKLDDSSEVNLFHETLDFKLPRLQELIVSSHTDDKTFLRILKTCPSLKDFRHVLMPSADTNTFFTECA